jgi:hypothetical protein
MMADRRLTYGYELVTETTTPKILPAGGDWYVLWAGSPMFAEVVTAPAIAMRVMPADIPAALQANYRMARMEATSRAVLEPRLLTPELYYARPSTMQPLDDRLRAEIDTEIRDFRFECQLLGAGFSMPSENGKGSLFTVDAGGLVHLAEGFGCIGSGANAALAALIFSKVNPDEDVDVQLYQLLYAKAHAEMTPFVGFELDAWIMTADRGLITVDKSIVGTDEALLDRVFEDAARLPFKPRSHWNARPGYKAPRKAPTGWEKKLRDYVNSVVGEP